MLSSITDDLRRGWKSLSTTDLVFKLLSFAVLVPAVSILFRLFVSLSGREVLADVEIASFFLHPIGLVTILVVGSALLAVLAFEMAALLLVCLSPQERPAPRPRQVLWAVATHSKLLFELSGRIVVACLLIVIPFLAVGGAIFLWLLTEHDINFYLTETPFEFKCAVALIGSVLAVMLGLLCYRAIGWVHAVPMVLFEDVAPKDALRESTKRSSGDRKSIATTLLAWAACAFAVRFIGSWIVVTLAQFLVSVSTQRLAILVVSLGVMLVLVWLANVASGVFSNITLAASIAALYRRSRSDEPIASKWDLEDLESSAFKLRLTRGRLLAAVIVLPLFAAVLGASLLHGIDVDDDVVVTAHRGGAVAAPENTLAAIQQGIDDGADWIEIDVQESRDGEVMVIHDSDLMKVAGKPIKIWEADAETLRSIDIGSFLDPRFKDERMPTLREALELCRGKAKVNIELKYYGHDQDLERKVIQIVEETEMESEIVVMSLESAAIKKMRELRPDWTLGLLTAVAIGDLTRVDADFLAVNTSLATGTFIQSAHRQEKTVAAWTLNDAYSMSLMLSRGVDNLITDRPALARQVIAERQQMSPVERLTLELAFYLGIRPAESD